ncbi:ABC transporter substrate-binding protein [Paucibacter sp. Y2R2-4]|uniref:ABC transporter substrate-binding protein n=1 Tax=Paucibacter sp. Y2R2-4 TaxID=2893553 RepID=UPI0021E45F1D|nr:ABC transporter substrate-binding protein [Paucibacter sp. Y2R2-4]MCV2351701.1 ABC transporter substrate-binding protein [Paucibacter sp. Y2R2-4]
MNPSRFLRLLACGLASVSLSLSLGLGLALPASASSAEAPAAPKVLRYAFQIAETGFDPAQISDTYSRIITSHVFEALYSYDYLARPIKVRPLTAAGMPEVSADFKTWTVRIQPGIFFTDDPAFKGKRRELVAEDYVYSYKRFADPASKSPSWTTVGDFGLIGLNELREQALKTKKPFNYEQPIEGLRALDRYTLQFKLKESRPRFIYGLAQSDRFGAVAREVMEAYADRTMEHPVGTGPFVLKDWRRSSRMVLEKNPAYRERYYEAEPAADDAEGQALLARFKGRRIPMIDRVEIAIIEESQPRWLSFVGGEHDLLDRVPPEFVNVALPKGKLAPNLAKRGFQLFRVMGAESAFTFFNLEDKTLGGYSEDKVALRRALSLALNIEREINGVRRGQAVPAQSMIPPHTSGYDAAYKSTNSDFDIPRAKALLDLYGYVDKDGDGWRDMPDGSPLVIEVATQPDALSRQYDELWQRNFGAVNIRTKFFHGKWPEQLKQARAGKLMLWMLADSANAPDGLDQMLRLYSPAIGARNYARFKSAEFDKLYEQLQVMPDGPEREALFLQVKRIQATYVPEKTHVHRIINDMSQAWVIGYRRPLFSNDFWQFIDVDNSLKPAR